MDENPLLAALRESYGAPPEEADTSTVRGLLAFCRGWLRGDTSVEQLNNPCLAMAGRLRQAADATYRDLDDNPELSEQAREPILLMGECFQAIANLLEQLLVLANEARRDEYEELLEEFEEERLAVLDASEEIQWQQSGRELRCPRCGADGEQLRCDECGLALMYPDRSQIQNSSRKSANLSPIHLAVYAAYIAVLEGQQSLEILARALPPLVTHLESMHRICQKEASGAGAAWAAVLARETEVGLSGARRMASAVETRRTSDLNRGWEDIFESSVATAREIGRLGGSSLSSPHDGLRLGGNSN